jgi:hypothetical protein
MIGADHRNSIIPFPLFHGTSSVFLPSVRTHGLGGKNIVEDWRILDFLRAGMAIIDGHIDRTDPTIEVQWKILQAAASQRVDRMNWRHGATYLIAAQFRAVMYATSSAYGSEIISFVGWLFKHCPLACRPALDAAIVNYPELSQCLRVKHGPLLIRAASVPVSSVLTEKGEDANGVICKLADELAKPDGLFNGVSQIGSFELREPLSAESLQFFRIIEATDGDELRYRLEMQQA